MFRCKNIISLSFSFELCSETNFFANDWPSDITFLINNTEVTTYTSPGDFGGRFGNFSPRTWPINCSQFGLLINLKIDNNGTYINDTIVNNNIRLNNLKLNEQKTTLTFLIKNDAIHVGGINLFGKNSGDYNQSIIMKIAYQD